MYLRRERQILVLQIEALRRENQQAEADLEAQFKLHQEKMHSLREESLQVSGTTSWQTDEAYSLPIIYCSDPNNPFLMHES